MNTKQLVQRAKKTGRTFTFEVYTASDGVTVVARLIQIATQSVNGQWSEPHIDEKVAIKEAWHLYCDKIIAQQDRQAEYYTSGGY